jgi:hypothetical protein
VHCNARSEPELVAAPAQRQRGARDRRENAMAERDRTTRGEATLTVSPRTVRSCHASTRAPDACSGRASG